MLLAVLVQAIAAALVCDGGWRPRTFSGGLLGVNAQLELVPKAKTATVTLNGVPLGGELHGQARFGSDGFTLELDEKLTKGLRRRRVEILGIGVFSDHKKVWVLLKLPLGLGRRMLTLIPTTSTTTTTTTTAAAAEAAATTAEATTIPPRPTP